MPGHHASRGILPGDVLDEVFSILRKDEMSYWDEHRHFEGDQRDLSACALVSQTWRELTTRHLFHDLVFTHGPVVDEACVDALHQQDCVFCPCSCHVGDPERTRREVSALLGFLQGAPHVRTAARSLRLRMSPLAIPRWFDLSIDAVDPVIFFETIECLPQLKWIYLEDIVLQAESTPLSQQRPSIEELTFSRCFQQEVDDSLHRIIQQFRHIGRLRFPSLLNGMPLNFQTRLTSIGFDGSSGGARGESILSLLARAESGPSSLEISILLADDDTLFQELLRVKGARLTHLVYMFRTPIFVGSLPFTPHRLSIPAYNLETCTNLQSFYTSVHMASLDLDLLQMLCPMLSSLQKSRAASLRQVVITAWVLQNPERHLGKDSVRRFLDQFQETIVQLRGRTGLSDVVFRLLYRPEHDQDLVTAYTNTLMSALPKLTNSGILRIVSKDPGPVLEMRSAAKQRTMFSDAIMSLISERV